jgi:radical SAM enzyme (TIGR01210 family)
MFDEREVPPEARVGILELISKTKCRSFLCETRVESLTERKIKEYATILGNKIASIEIGLESSNPWILKYCVNKNLSLEDYRKAVQLLRKHSLGTSTTVMLGSAFLSPREAIEDTVQTVRWAFEQGTERACIFPAHVKKWTLLEWLWKRNLYSPPSLWSLVEVLMRLGRELSPRVYTAWYRVYDQESQGVHLDSVNDLEYLCSPSTCENCRPQVMELLDAYRDRHTFAVVEELSRLECECKTAWSAAIQAGCALPLRERVASAYRVIGNELLPSDWWTRHGSEILGDVREA